GQASLASILQRQAGKNNSFPLLQYNAMTYALPNYNTQKSLWPLSDVKEKKQVTFFGNENSILSQGFEINANLRTTDQDKNDHTPFTYAHARYMDSTNYNLIAGKNATAFIWCF